MPRIGQSGGAKGAEAAGASEAQIRRQGRWNTDKMTGCYLTTLPRKAMRCLSGFDVRGGGFWIQQRLAVLHYCSLPLFCKICNFLYSCGEVVN